MPTFFDTYQSGLTCKLLLAPLPTLGCPCLLSGVTIGTTDTRWQNTEHYRQNYSLAPTITFIIPIYIRAKGGVIVFRLEGRGGELAEKSRYRWWGVSVPTWKWVGSAPPPRPPHTPPRDRPIIICCAQLMFTGGFRSGKGGGHIKPCHYI